MAEAEVATMIETKNVAVVLLTDRVDPATAVTHVLVHHLAVATTLARGLHLEGSTATRATTTLTRTTMATMATRIRVP